VCPNNIATTANDFLRAFFHDLTIAIRLFLSCFGPSGPAACVCNILMLMRPAWVDNLPTDQMKCQGGNIFGLIVGKITDIVLQWAEYLVNWAIEKFESIVCGWFGCSIDRVCLTVGENVYRCEHAWGGDSLEWMLGCGYRADTREARRCFFSRQRAICMEGDPSRYKRYQKLFEAPKKAELEQDFFSIVGKYAPAPHRTDPGTPPISLTPRPAVPLTPYRLL